MPFQPFSHESLEMKRQFLMLGRKFHDFQSKEQEEAVAYEFAAALIYMNVADYLAQYLAYSIAFLASHAVSDYHLGVINMKKPQTRNVAIEKSMKLLEPYDFPRKEDIVNCLGRVKKSRNTVAHEILKTDVDEITVIDQAVSDLKTDTEELVELIDQIQLGMPPKNLRDLVESQ